MRVWQSLILMGILVMDNINDIKNSSISTSANVYNFVRIVNSSIGENCTIGDDCDVVNLTMEERSEIGRRNIIRDSFIGKGSYTGTNTIIKNAIIGRYCSISWNVSIGGGNHNYNNISMYTDYWYKRTFGIDFPAQHNNINVTIGNDVWIGAGAIVNNGITIGDGAVIGAGAIVTKNVEPYEIVVGVPAKKMNTRFSNDIIAELQRIKWWNWEDEVIKKNISILRNSPCLEELLLIEESNV